MSGIYIHIPFCKQACHYCNFHFSTSLKYKSELIEALTKELILRANYLPHKHLTSVYIGGGTPSVLNTNELNSLFDTILQTFTIDPAAEITLEANPDDLSLQKLHDLRQTPINRLSIGIQSFNNADLLFMNRAHNAQQADFCIKAAQDVGFDNLSIDLIYGSPTTSNLIWEQNLDKALAYQIPHLSCYCLTVEPKTALDSFVKHQKVPPVNEEQAAQQFEQLINRTTQAGYLHYEISNFCLPNRFAQHNSSYWKGNDYLGIGPSAHSFNQTSRQWNVANNAQYIKAINQGIIPAEIEQLSNTQRFNEYLLTSLRTIWGCSLTHIKQHFGDAFVAYLQKAILPFEGFIVQKNETLFLNNKGKLLADKITSELFWAD
ncbi:MAG: radical SAM family heme chaperone HemW [Sphingobacteriales bacterium]|nr:radical SAM family heme chaperone HemW [Sphingobacteriales bacterium]